MHAQRQLESALLASRKTANPVRFWRRVDKSGGDDACWPWLGQVRPNGYGIVKFVHEGVAHHTCAHRLAFLLGGGRFTDESPVVDHLCRNRCCCNPRHLEAVSTKLNNQRGLSGQLRVACPQGHALDGWHGGGYRYCKECARQRATRNRRRKVALSPEVEAAVLAAEVR